MTQTMTQVPEFERVAGALRRSEEDLITRQLEALREFRSYHRVPEVDLRRSARRNVLRVCAMLRGREELPEEAEEHEHASGARRALQGVPAEDVAAAYHAVMGVLRDAVIEEATRAGVPLHAILLGTRLLWQLTDRFGLELVAAHAQRDRELARRQERQRVAFLQRLLSGSLLPAEIIQHGAAYDLQPGHEYWVFRARQPAGRLQGLSRHIEQMAAGPTFAPLVGPIDGDLAGLTVRRPTVNDEVTTLAVAGPASLDQLAHAFMDATRVLNVALRYQRSGVVDSASLSIRIAVVQEDRIGQILYERYVAPVLTEGQMAETLLESVRVYLKYKRRVQAAADALLVHINTLRYRLERYQAITKIDISETESIIEVWWALEYWALYHGAIGGTSEQKR